MAKTRHNDRRCVATGAALPPGAQALRFVRSPGGEVVLDLAERLPGRGAWVTARREAVEKAARKGAFSRAFKAQTQAPGELADRVGALLAERALSRLGLARRAGQLFVGFEAVRERAGELCAYLSPEDASPDGVSKVAAKLAAAGAAHHIPLPARAEAVGAAIGEPGAVHIGLAKGGAGRAAAEAAALWAAYADEAPSEGGAAS